MLHFIYIYSCLYTRMYHKYRALALSYARYRRFERKIKTNEGVEKPSGHNQTRDQHVN